MKNKTLIIFGLTISLLSSCSLFSSISKEEAINRANNILLTRASNEFPGDRGWNFIDEYYSKTSKTLDGQITKTNYDYYIQNIFDVDNNYYYYRLSTNLNGQQNNTQIYIYETEEKYVIAVDKSDVTAGKSEKWYQNIPLTYIDFSGLFTLLNENLANGDDITQIIQSTDMLENIESLYEVNVNNEEAGITASVTASSINNSSLSLTVKNKQTSEGSKYEFEGNYEFKNYYLSSMKETTKSINDLASGKQTTEVSRKCQISFDVTKHKYPNLDKFTKKLYI